MYEVKYLYNSGSEEKVESHSSAWCNYKQDNKTFFSLRTRALLEFLQKF